MRADQSQLAQHAWDAVERFVTGSDPQASTALYRILHDSAEDGGVHVLTLPAPQLLQHIVRAPVEGTPARLLVVAMLNHLFCTRLLPLMQQRPADRRATGLEELEELYLTVLNTTSLNPAVERQLVPCVSTLLVLNHTSALSAARRRFLGDVDRDSVQGQQQSPVHRQRYLSVFVSLCDVLTDDRIPFGPVQRARQLRDLQRSLEMVLSVAFADENPAAAGWTPSSGESSVALGAVRAVGRGAALLLERASEEPLTICPVFWKRLPSQPVWQLCLTRAYEGAADAIEAVCHVLRCLTTMEPASEELLTSALNMALQIGDTKSQCQLITAALEAATEGVILHYDPTSPLFQLLSRAAEHLIAPLQSSRSGSTADATEEERDECDLLACEGVAVLAQTLTPFPIPEMEPSDDPEDYTAIVEEMQAKNTDKARVLSVMRDFFVVAQRLLFQRLACRVSEDDYAAIAEHVTQLLDDHDDTAVAFDSTSVAYYSTYERLHGLLGTLPVEAISAVQQNTVTLAAVGCNAQATLWFTQQQLTRVLQLALSAAEATSAPTQSSQTPSPHAHAAALPATGTPLLPVLIRRFTAPHNDLGVSTSSSPAWQRDEIGSLVEPLVAQCQIACSHVRLLATAQHVMACISALLDVSTAQQGLGIVNSLPQTVFPIAWVWLGRVSEAAATLEIASRQHCQLVAQHLGDWLQRRFYVPASLTSLVTQAASLAPPFQLEVLSALPAANLNDLASVLDLVPCTLHWLGEARHAAVLRRIGQRVAAQAAHILAADASTAAPLTDLIRRYASESQVVCPILLTLVTHCAMLPHAAGTALEVVSQGIRHLGAAAEVATSDLCWILEERVCMLLAGAVRSSSPSTETVCGLLESLLRPSPSFTTSNGVRRLHLIARLGRMLVASEASASARLLACYAEALQRLLECFSAASLEGFSISPSTSASRSAVRGSELHRKPVDDGGESDDAVVTSELLQEMAAFGRCASAPGANTAAASVPAVAASSACLARLSRCGDDFERLAVLKQFVQ